MVDDLRGEAVVPCRESKSLLFVLAGPFARLVMSAKRTAMISMTQGRPSTRKIEGSIFVRIDA